MKHLAMHPTDPEGHVHLARFYWEHGRPLAAVAECRTSLALGGGQTARDLLSTACAAGDYDGKGSLNYS